jgi:hypothetical protein
LQRVPDAGLQKRANFSTLMVGLAGTGDQTRAACVAGSGTNRSAIHYDFCKIGHGLRKKEDWTRNFRSFILRTILAKFTTMTIVHYLDT